MDNFWCEIDEVEKLVKEEEEEELRMKDEFVKECDEFWLEVIEKERVSCNLKCEVNIFEW